MKWSGTDATNRHWGQVISKVLSPAITVPLVVLGFAIYASPGADGLRYVMLAVLLCGGLPVAFVFGLARARVVESTDVTPRRQRLWTLVGLSAIEAVAIVVLYFAGAPRLLVSLIAACFFGVAAMARTSGVMSAIAATPTRQAAIRLTSMRGAPAK